MVGAVNTRPGPSITNDKPESSAGLSTLRNRLNMRILLAGRRSPRSRIVVTVSQNPVFWNPYRGHARRPSWIDEDDLDLDWKTPPVLWRCLHLPPRRRLTLGERALQTRAQQFGGEGAVTLKYLCNIHARTTIPPTKKTWDKRAVFGVVVDRIWRNK